MERGGERGGEGRREGRRVNAISGYIPHSSPVTCPGVKVKIWLGTLGN